MHLIEIHSMTLIELMLKKIHQKRLYTTYTTSTVDTLNHENICPMRILSIRHEKN